MFFDDLGSLTNEILATEHGSFLIVADNREQAVFLLGEVARAINNRTEEMSNLRFRPHPMLQMMDRDVRILAVEQASMYRVRGFTFDGAFTGINLEEQVAALLRFKE